MRFLFVISFILITSSYARAEAENTILVFGEKQLFDNPEYNRKLTELELKLVKSYESLNAQKLVLKSKTSPVKSCESLKAAFKEIKICELDKKLKPDQEVLCKRPVIESAYSTLSQGVELILNKDLNCELVYSKEELPKVAGLTPLWAQEYTGADLLRKRMVEEGVDTTRAKELIGILDSDLNKHGEQVSNLIAGDKVSSLIPMNQNLGYKQGIRPSDYLDYYEECSKDDSCSKYINHSMDWGGVEAIKEVVSKLQKEQGTVYVASAGNKSGKVDPLKEELSKAGQAILVGSHGPDGTYSNFSNYSEEVLVSAPSGFKVLSYDYDGKPLLFGGTSGAAPQVTGALASFELISGVSLDTKISKDLLKKTAIKFPKDPDSKLLGAGFLNTYKIGMLAFKVKELCQSAFNKTACGRKLLTNDEFYEIDVDEEAHKNFEQAFPACSGNFSDLISASCGDKKMALENFRKAALLSSNPDMWSGLSCVYKELGHHENAKYYAKLARRSRFTPKTNLFKLRAGELAEVLGNEQFSEELDKAIGDYLAKGGYGLKFAHHRFISNKPLMMKVLENDGSKLSFASEELKSDREVVLTAVKSNGGSIEYAADYLKGDKEVAKMAVRQDGNSLKHISKELQDSKEMVLDAVKHAASSLQFASERLKGDREVVLAAIKNNGQALEFASEEVKAQKDIALTAIKNGGSLKDVSLALKSDDEVVVEALGRFGGELEHVAEKYKSDRKIVLMAIKEQGLALKYASPELQNDKEIVMKAIEDDPSAFEYASPDLRNDKQIVLMATENYTYPLRHASEEIRGDKNFIKDLVKKKWTAIEFVTDELKNDREVVLSAMSFSAYAFEYASKELQNDKEVIKAFVEKLGVVTLKKMYPEVIENLKDDPEFLATLN
tara:strand:- start:39957 stop:42635 length:2679 start_codon:yes stop_codon:yes gene_type:complete